MQSIDDLDLSKTYTYADYYSWRFEERLELIKGKRTTYLSKVLEQQNTDNIRA